MTKRPKTRNRLLLYIGISTLTSLIAGMTLGMFGDGTLTWAQFRFSWAILILKVVVDGCITARAFIDRTPSDEKAEQDKEAWKQKRELET